MIGCAAPECRGDASGQALRGDEEEGEEAGHVEGTEDDALPPPCSAWQLPGGEEGEDARRECPHQCREDRMPWRKGVGGDDVRRPPTRPGPGISE